MNRYTIEFEGRRYVVEATSDAEAMDVVRQQAAQASAPEAMTAQQRAEADLTEMGVIVPREEAARRAYEENKVGSGVMSAARGVPFAGEYLDEAAGALASAAGGPPASIGAERVRLAQEGYEAANPTAALVGQVGAGLVGGAAMGLGAAGAATRLAPGAIATIARYVPQSMLGQVLAGLGIGAAGGAVEGAVSGYGAGGMEEAGRRAQVGGAIGGAVGAAAPLVSRAASNVVEAVRGRPTAEAARGMGGSPEAVEIVGRMLQNDDPAQAAARVASAGRGAMVADAGPATQGLLDTAIQRAGPGGRVAREAIERRAGEATAEMRTALDRYLGDARGIRELGREVSERTQAARQAAYDAAYARPINYADATGQRIEDVLSRVPPRTLSAAVQDANEEMISLGLRNQQIMVEIADDGTVTFREMPNVMQLDKLKQALDRMGAETDVFGRPTQGALRPRRLARELRAALTDAVPEYGRAVQLGGQKIAEDSALDIGRRLLRSNTTREDVADAMEGATAAQIAAARAGVRSQIDEAVGNVRRAMTDGNMDARQGIQILRELSSDNVREKLRLVMGDRPARALLARVDRAAKAFELRASVAQNSRTFSRMSMDEAIRELTSPGAVGELLQGSPLQSGRRLLQQMTDMTPEARRAVEERISGEIASILTTARGRDAVERVNELVKILERTPETQELARRIGVATAAVTAGGAYQAGTRALNTPAP